MASPAEPVLASTLWTSHLSTQTREPSDPVANQKILATGCRSIDNVLVDGLQYGTTTCVSAEADSGARALSQTLLVSHLLSSAYTTAAVIDTTLSFDVRELHKAMTAEMDGQGDAVQMSVKVLDRLKIMKVFDFVGLTESIRELRDALEGNVPSADSVKAVQQAPRGTVGDSEDEDEDEDEMLDSPTSPPPCEKPLLENRVTEVNHSLLIIDNITQVAAPLLKNNLAQGQALLSSFMRSLSHLTKTHHLCTILHNHATSNIYIKEETPSIFSSCTVRPALGKTFAYTLDTHMLLHRAPRGADDAKAVYGGVGADRRQRLAQMCNVVEVLQDRHGGRVGRWAAFNVDDSGRLVGVV